MCVETTTSSRRSSQSDASERTRYLYNHGTKSHLPRHATIGTKFSSRSTCNCESFFPLILISFPSPISEETLISFADDILPFPAKKRIPAAIAHRVDCSFDERHRSSLPFFLSSYCFYATDEDNSTAINRRDRRKESLMKTCSTSRLSVSIGITPRRRRSVLTRRYRRRLRYIARKLLSAYLQ